MLETDDPAAGSELFTWRAFVGNVMSTLEAIGQKLNKRQGRIALVAGIATVATLGFVTGRRSHEPAKPKASLAQVVPQQLVVNKETGSSYKVSSGSGGTFTVDITLTDAKPLTVRLPGIAIVPPGWHARVMVSSISTPALEVTMFDDSRVLDNAVELSASSCGLAAPELEANVRGEPGTYTLYIKPVLEPAGC